MIMGRSQSHSRPAAFEWAHYDFGKTAVAVPVSLDVPTSPTSINSSSTSTSTSETASPSKPRLSIVVNHEPALCLDDLEAREILSEAADGLDEMFSDKLLLQSFPGLRGTMDRQRRLQAQLEEYERGRGQFHHAVNCVLHTRAKFEARVRTHGEHVQNLMERLLGRRFSTLTDPRSGYSPVQLALLEQEFE